MIQSVKTAYRVNLFFYVFEALIIFFVGLFRGNINFLLLLSLLVYTVITVPVLMFAFNKAKISTFKYGVLQRLLFLVIDVYLMIVFDSAQVFIYALSFASVLNFMFMDNKLARFQLWYTFGVLIFSIVMIVIFIRSEQTILEFSFGSMALIVLNWIIMTITTNINYQTRQNKEQEQSLDDLLRVVEVKCDDARHATRAKTRFLATMSHEIRTPINAIIGMNEMILRESSEMEICGYASETKIAAEALLTIINDILDITKIEFGGVTVIPVEYETSKLITDVYNMIKFKAEEKGLEFVTIIDENLPSVMVGDDIRIKQILTNLLNNAVKYTHSGKVILEIKYLTDGDIFFAVRDTGIGIKKEDINKLFVMFNRAEEEKHRSIEGTGLGLPITASILKVFGSSLRVESTYGEGSEFSFVLSQEIVEPKPIGEIDFTVVRTFERKSYNSQFIAPDAHVLVVDDNEMNRKVFKNLLKGTKINIDEADSGKQCLDLVRKNRYDIIFMDHMMPEMDGVETFEVMRGMDDNLCKDTPVIILTANAVVGAKEFYLKSGFDDFISKPVDPIKLEKMVRAKLSDDIVTEGAFEPEEDEEHMKIDELPIINGIDWSYGKSHFKEEEPMFHAINMFYNSIKSDMEELNTYFEEIDTEIGLDRYRIKVHSMKSSASLIGIVQLSGMAMELEAAARNYNVDVIKALHPVFAERWLSYHDEMSVLVEVKTPKKNAEDYRDEINEIFVKIRSGAEDMDIDVLDAMSSKLSEYMFSGEVAEEIERVKTDIFNFEVEKLRVYEFKF